MKPGQTHKSFVDERKLVGDDKVELDPYVQNAIAGIIEDRQKTAFEKEGTALIMQPHIMEYVYQALIDGKRPIDITKTLKVAPQLFYVWRGRYPTFKKLVDEANRIKASKYIDEMVEIADNDSEDKIISDDGVVRPNAANVARSKLKIQTRRKVAAIYDPVNYSENIGGSGVNINGNVFMGLQITPPTSKNDDEEKEAMEVIDVDKEQIQREK